MVGTAGDGVSNFSALGAGTIHSIGWILTQKPEYQKILDFSREFRNPNPRISDETNARQRVGSRPSGLRLVIVHSDLVIHSGIRGFGISLIRLDSTCWNTLTLEWVDLAWRIHSNPSVPPATQHPQVERQIVLPLSKAIEIAYKSIRLRLSRSLLVTSGIILALAFLMSILTTDRMTAGMREWAMDFPRSVEAAQLAQQREAIENERFKPVDLELHKAASQPLVITEGAERFDPVKGLGASFADLQKEVGIPLPASDGDLVALLTRHPDQVGKMQQWLAAARDLKRVREQLVAPQRLQETMKNAGVPSTPSEIASNRIQTRWLIGLALLVAFAGILNAMLMSVTERFREIGTMKCLGALDSFIIKLFLIESLFQGVVGTVIGVLLGLGLSMANMSTNYGIYAWKHVPWGGMVGSILLCLGVGVVLTIAGALYPAWQAAKMQPIEAMRVEA
jgi:hypothetical protein